jgi:mannose-6-phosphate isomerase-like protein (cupin superfamily)
MQGFIGNLEALTENNNDYRRVVHTGKHLQLVLMFLAPGGQIGEETHDHHDQFFRIEKGRGEVWIDGKRTKVKGDDAFIVPAGARHNVINTHDKPLRLFTLYGPPEHREALVETSRSVGDAPRPRFDSKTTKPSKG